VTLIPTILTTQTECLLEDCVIALLC
jgi:hypothetical protein